MRVLYNKEEVTGLRGVAPGGLMGLRTFEEDLLGSFVLSEADHRAACAAPLEHDAPLPLPRAAAAAVADLSGGGSGGKGAAAGAEK